MHVPVFWSNFTGCVTGSVRDSFIKQLGGYLIFSLLTLEIYEKREGLLGDLPLMPTLRCPSSKAFNEALSTVQGILQVLLIVIRVFLKSL